MKDQGLPRCIGCGKETNVLWDGFCPSCFIKQSIKQWWWEWGFVVILAAIFVGLVVFFVCLDVYFHEMACRESCAKLGMEYFRWDPGGLFGSSECWCRVDNKVIQVW